MLTKVEIENYQSHENTEIEFVPGTNVIIGESDAGKSVIFRAINWVCFNRPLGDFFRSEWGGDTRVALYTSEGDVVERIRTASKNEYVINGQVLKAFGSEVPEEIENILKIDMANIHAQMDMPFLLSSTPGEAAQLLNKAASIDDIDHAISGLKKSQNKISNDIKYDRGQLAENREQLKRYENIPTLENKLIRAEEAENAYNEKNNRLKNLKQITVEIRGKESQLKEIDYIPKLIQKHTVAESLYATYQNKSEHYKKLNVIINKITKTERSLNSTEYVESAIGVLKDAEKGVSAYAEKRKRVNEMRGIISSINNSTLQINKIQKIINKLQKEFNASFPDICPLCGK